MKKLIFKVQINAPREKVWQILWDDKTYREWTSVFAEGSHAESDWKEGSPIRFCDEKGNGLHSLIEKKIGFTQMTFKHLGELKGGKETPINWGEARESYFLTELDGQTELKVELDIVEELESYFNEIFPKAVQLIKQISERP